LSDDVKTVPAKVADLTKEVEELKAQAESDKTRIASLELKAAKAGKLGGMDFVKIGSLVCAIAGGVSWTGQTFVRAELAAALSEVQIKQARIETAVDFLREAEPAEKGGEK